MNISPLPLIKRFNLGSHGFTHLLTMDQDSFADNSFKKYRSAVEETVAIYGPAIYDNFNKRTAIPDCKKIITSGMLLNLQYVRKIGFFSEKYKIDYVDFEYVLRAIHAGFSTKIVSQCLLRQHYGAPSNHKRCSSLNYSPKRLYFQTRNRMRLRRDYPYDAAVAGWFSVNPKLIVKIILYEEQKLSKLWAILRGTIDGMKS